MADETKTSSGSTRKKSGARAKPARQAADSVRTGQTITTGRKSSKRDIAAERLRNKSSRKQSRDYEERVSTVSDILLRRNEEYAALRRLWIMMFVVGVVFMFVSLIAGYYADDVPESMQELMSTAAIVGLICAYAFVIGALIFDLVKLRPFRKAAQAQAASMTAKAIEKTIYEAGEEEALARMAQQEAAKSGNLIDKAKALFSKWF